MGIRHYFNVLMQPLDLSPGAWLIHPLDLFWSVVRYACGDWGECCPGCWAANDRAVRHGGDVQSVYTDRRGVEFYLYTPPDRSRTLVFLVDEL